MAQLTEDRFAAGDAPLTRLEPGSMVDFLPFNEVGR